MPSTREYLYKLLRKKHFQAVYKFIKKNVERVEETKPMWKYFLYKNKNKNVEKITEQKNIILKVTINNFDLDIQMDTGSEAIIISINFWERFGKPTLRKSCLLLRQFDGSVIKTAGYFEGSLELKNKFEVIPIIVTTCKKNHGLLRNDIFNIEASKLTNEIKMEKNGKLEKL